MPVCHSSLALVSMPAHGSFSDNICSESKVQICVCSEPLPVLRPWHPLRADVGVQIAAWRSGLGGTEEVVHFHCSTPELCLWALGGEDSGQLHWSPKEHTDFLVWIVPDCTLPWRKSTKDCADNLQATVGLGTRSEFSGFRWVPNMLFSSWGKHTLPRLPQEDWLLCYPHI